MNQIHVYFVSSRQISRTSVKPNVYQFWWNKTPSCTTCWFEPAIVSIPEKDIEQSSPPDHVGNQGVLRRSVREIARAAGAER